MLLKMMKVNTMTLKVKNPRTGSLINYCKKSAVMRSKVQEWRKKKSEKRTIKMEVIWIKKLGVQYRKNNVT